MGKKRERQRDRETERQRDRETERIESISDIKRVGSAVKEEDHISISTISLEIEENTNNEFERTVSSTSRTRRGKNKVQPLNIIQRVDGVENVRRNTSISNLSDEGRMKN